MSGRNKLWTSHPRPPRRSCRSAGIIASSILGVRTQYLYPARRIAIIDNAKAIPQIPEENNIETNSQIRLFVYYALNRLLRHLPRCSKVRYNRREQRKTNRWYFVAHVVHTSACSKSPRDHVGTSGVSIAHDYDTSFSFQIPQHPVGITLHFHGRSQVTMKLRSRMTNDVLRNHNVRDLPS